MLYLKSNGKREAGSPAFLAQTLQNLRKRLDDPNIISGDVVLSMLISFRDIQVGLNCNSALHAVLDVSFSWWRVASGVPQEKEHQR